MTKHEKCDKTWQEWQNVISVTKHDKCNITWQVWNFFPSVTKQAKVKKWQVWQYVRSMTKCGKSGKCDQTLFFSPGIFPKPKSKFHLWDKINKKSPKIHFGLFCYLLEFNLRWSFHANQYSISLNIIRCLQCQGPTEAEFVLQHYLFS